MLYYKDNKKLKKKKKYGNRKNKNRKLQINKKM